jgi:3-oxoacyl-[acyl-carrier protein] reductase
MSTDPFSLHGLTALVTGAGSPAGIGFATARLLGRVGATVALTSTTARVREREAELVQAGLAASSHVADLTSTTAVRALVDAVLSRHGRVDVLVNNAGMSRVGSPEITGDFVRLTHKDWMETLERNLMTAVGLTRALLPGMIERGAGRVINVASVTGALVASPGEAPYAAAKAAMVGLTRTLALETAAYGITVNAVAPGWIATASSTPNEVAAVITFLASHEASYITGQLLVVDGGNTIQEYKASRDG